MKGTEQQQGDWALRPAIACVGRMSSERRASELVAGCPLGVGSLPLLPGLLGSISGGIKEYSQQLLFTEHLLCEPAH